MEGLDGVSAAGSNVAGGIGFSLTRVDPEPQATSPAVSNTTQNLRRNTISTILLE
jgi:hypothetical protein